MIQTVSTQQKKPYDLHERTSIFADSVRALMRRLPAGIQNAEDGRQLIRSSGSVGANYIEANEALGKKDRIMHLKICRKEAKESVYWLRLLHVVDGETEKQRQALIQEAQELLLIFASMT